MIKGDLGFFILTVLALPLGIGVALTSGSVAKRGGVFIQVSNVLYYAGWALFTAQVVMAVLLWRSWRKGSSKPPGMTNGQSESNQDRT